jgi:hypothetical protein
MKFATIDDFHQYVISLQRRAVHDVGKVVPNDAELKEACEYLALRLLMLRNDIVDLEYLDVLRPVSLPKLIEPELRCMIRDLRAAWDAMEARIRRNGDRHPF